MRFSLRDPTQLPGTRLARPQNVCTTTLEIDDAAVRKAQIRKLEQVRRQRDSGRAEAALSALAEIASSGNGNILAAAVEAARARATPEEHVIDGPRR
jgi:methylmalonyl-CoA mutase N-terminal domain/subunit